MEINNSPIDWEKEYLKLREEYKETMEMILASLINQGGNVFLRDNKPDIVSAFTNINILKRIYMDTFHQVYNHEEVACNHDRDLDFYLYYSDDNEIKKKMDIYKFMNSMKEIDTEYKENAEFFNTPLDLKDMK